MSRRTKPRAWFYYLARNAILLYLRLRMPVKFYGRENVPPTGGLLVASNHASYLDPPLLSMAVKSRFVRYLARDTLFTRPLANWFFLKGGVLPMDRTKGDLGALKVAIKMLKEGECVAMFPEGTRTENGELQESKGGVAFLISKAAVPVLPVYIDGTFHAFPKNAKKLTPHPISLHIGKPIAPDELVIHTAKGKMDYDAIGRKVMARIAELKPPASA